MKHGEIADMYAAAAKAYQSAPSCVLNPEGFDHAIAEGRRLEALADEAAEKEYHHD